MLAILIIITLALIGACIGCGIYATKTHSTVPEMLAWMFGLLTLVPSILILAGLHINFRYQTYTGYIYSVEGNIGKAVGHIRFSQNAGEDTQPSFCVNLEDREMLEQYVGTDTKVKVTEPAGTTWTLFGCGLPVTVEEIQ